eukprot:FR736900.1.p3 GENE.FR736900.1~~FR736900.1.p3  ORF type:complete len:107 (-),score=33.39 FR736900.1:748-1068(-)
MGKKTPAQRGPFLTGPRPFVRAFWFPKFFSRFFPLFLGETLFPPSEGERYPFPPPRNAQRNESGREGSEKAPHTQTPSSPPFGRSINTTAPQGFPTGKGGQEGQRQ